MPKTVLVLGASGRFGGNAAEQFAKAGWVVRRFRRDRDDLTGAIKDVDVIVNAWNPPYPDWERQVPVLHAQVIRAARKANATVIVPGNVYVFGAGTPAPWSNASPHDARNRLGRIRIEMEQSYRRSGVRTIVLRAGDFIDTKPSGNWFDQIMTKSLHKGVFVYPGQADIPHAWAYLPDICRAAVELAEMRDRLPVFTDVSFPGFTMSGNDMVQALNRVVPDPVRLRSMSWLPLILARPFWPMAACLLEMRYLWDTPHSLDGTQFADLLPEFRSTPVDVALDSAVRQLPSVQSQIDPDQTMTAGG